MSIPLSLLSLFSEAEMKGRSRHERKGKVGLDWIGLCDTWYMGVWEVKWTRDWREEEEEEVASLWTKETDRQTDSFEMCLKTNHMTP